MTAPAPLPLPEVRALTPSEVDALLWFQGAAMQVSGLGLWQPAKAALSASFCQGSKGDHCGAIGEYQAVRFFRFNVGGEPRTRIQILCKPCASRWAKKYGAMIPELDRWRR